MKMYKTFFIFGFMIFPLQSYRVENSKSLEEFKKFEHRCLQLSHAPTEISEMARLYHVLKKVGVDLKREYNVFEEANAIVVFQIIGTQWRRRIKRSTRGLYDLELHEKHNKAEYETHFNECTYEKIMGGLSSTFKYNSYQKYMGKQQQQAKL